ncbi:MAG: DUF4058 family protein [Planctomycetota bacterium]
MPSPFPGMDPYLENPRIWREVHHLLIGNIKIQLLPSLPDPYYAVLEEDLYIHEPPAEDRLFARADDAIILTDEPGGRSVETTAVSSKASLTMRIPVIDPELPERLQNIEIRTASNDRVITVIELVSRTNKLGGRRQFIEKRLNLLSAGVNLLQIDLLRVGETLLPQESPPHDYSAMLTRGYEPTADVWMWTLRDKLPILPVPLANDDPDIVLDLRAALDITYDASRYSPRIYRHAPDPPLAEDLVDWADALVPSAS